MWTGKSAWLHVCSVKMHHSRLWHKVCSCRDGRLNGSIRGCNWCKGSCRPRSLDTNYCSQATAITYKLYIIMLIALLIWWLFLHESMQVKTPERAQNVCTRLMWPTGANSQALAKIFPKAPNINILKRPPPAFDPTAECVARAQKKKKAATPSLSKPKQITIDVCLMKSVLPKGKLQQALCIFRRSSCCECDDNWRNQGYYMRCV